MKFFIKLWQCFCCWRVAPATDAQLRDCQAILGQSFGAPESGVSNRSLAEIADWLYTKYELPLILQWEIAENLLYGWPFLIIWEHSQPGKYLDTYEVIRQSVQVCCEKGWTKVVILGHPDHVWRCKMVAEYFGLTVMVPRDIFSVPYDPMSEQWWTRGDWFFIPREIGSRLLYLAKGWI